MALEQQIQKQILDYLKAKGLMCWKNHTQHITVGNGIRIPNPNAGCPDILGYFPNGIGFAIEVKSPGKKLSKTQENWLKKAQENNVFAFWTDNLSHVCIEIESYLHGMKKKK